MEGTLRAINQQSTMGRPVREDGNLLMIRIQEGDEDAFFELVARYKNMVVNYLFRTLGEYETAVELAQEVFIKIHRYQERYNPDLKFSTWIYKIATNVAIDEIRRRARRIHALPLEPSQDDGADWSGMHFQKEDLSSFGRPESVLLEREMGSRIMDAVWQLPPEQRSIFILKEIEETPLEEISQLTGVKIGTLKSRLHRARHFLKERLEGYVCRR